jgi:hypothetical protein
VLLCDPGVWRTGRHPRRWLTVWWPCSPSPLQKQPPCWARGGGEPVRRDQRPGRAWSGAARGRCPASWQ